MSRIRPRLISWQFQDYHLKHASRFNLLIHIFAVPVFWLGCAILLEALFNLVWQLAVIGLLVMVISFVIQGIGHKGENSAPEPFLGPVDFLSRFLVEQLVTFPRFLLTGGWWRSLRLGRG